MNANEAASFIESNRKRWDSLVEAHAQSKFYDLEGFKAGRSSLKAPELDLTGPVQGKNLLHLQCHFGQDTLSLARMGAHVTGVDISDKAISLARQLSVELELPAEFICCNVYDLPQRHSHLHDIVFSTYGAIPWLPDLEAWAKMIADRLVHGGIFVLVEFHPAWMMFDFNTMAISYSYFNHGAPYVEATEGSYVDAAPGELPAPALEECFWNHGIADVLGPLMRNGLILERFEEYDYSAWNCFPGFVEVAPGKWKKEGMPHALPMMYGMRLRKV